MPISITQIFERIQQELSLQAEEQVIQRFRISKAKTIISLKFILILIIIPILTQQVSKNFLVSPIVDQLRNPESTEIFLNADLEEEALHELQRFKKFLEFKNLTGLGPHLSKEEKEEAVKQKASEIKQAYQNESSNAIKNIFADIIVLSSFSFLLWKRKKEREILKSFLKEVIYGLSDSAKAFMIIMFTDMFVGFHSSDGWEVILEAVARHLEIPANQEFISLFIATFPVILDTMFKYLIFRYLSRISPSTAATYKNMNQ